MDDELFERRIHSLAVAVYMQSIIDYILLNMGRTSTFHLCNTSDYNIESKKREIIEYLFECGNVVPGFSVSNLIKYMDENKEYLYKKVLYARRGGSCKRRKKVLKKKSEDF